MSRARRGRRVHSASFAKAALPAGSAATAASILQSRDRRDPPNRLVGAVCKARTTEPGAASSTPRQSLLRDPAESTRRDQCGAPRPPPGSSHVAREDRLRFDTAHRIRLTSSLGVPTGGATRAAPTEAFEVRFPKPLSSQTARWPAFGRSRTRCGGTALGESPWPKRLGFHRSASGMHRRSGSISGPGSGSFSGLDPRHRPRRPPPLAPPALASLPCSLPSCSTPACRSVTVSVPNGASAA